MVPVPSRKSKKHLFRKPDLLLPGSGLSRVAGELLFRLAAGHVTLLHSVLGLARIELVVADANDIGAG